MLRKKYSPQTIFGEAQGSTNSHIVNDPTSPVASEHDTVILSPSTPRSPFSTNGLRRLSSPTSSGYPSWVDSDDAVSISSSASTSKPCFRIPDYWPPAIMECIDQPSLEEQKRSLNPSIRNEITRALGTHMFSYNPKPTKSFCTEVARMLVKKYPFMRDTGKKESGYVSDLYVHNMYILYI